MRPARDGSRHAAPAVDSRRAGGARSRWWRGHSEPARSRILRTPCSCPQRTGGFGLMAANLPHVELEGRLVAKAPAVRTRTWALSTPWSVLALALSSVIAFAWILHTQLQRLYGLTAPVWDLGQGQQVLWSLASGHGWASSFELGHN